MSKRYNKKIYGAFADGTKIVRKYCSPDPAGRLKENGLTGKALGYYVDKKIENPIHKLSFKLTSLTYNKRKDKPYKGSATYSAWYITIKAILKFILGFIFGLSAVSLILAVTNNFLLIVARLALVIAPIIIVIFIVKYIKKFFKKKF